MSRKRNKKGNIKTKILTILLILSLIVIAYSIYLNQSPDKATNFIFSKITGKNIKSDPPVDSLLYELNLKDGIIDSLSGELKVFEKNNMHKKALVNVESGTLNMREKPLLASGILARIPDSSFVDVLYFDTKYYYLNGTRGRWCRVKYADKEGWVWDGFIEIQ